jgi:hypothetical protein
MLKWISEAERNAQTAHRYRDITLTHVPFISRQAVKHALQCHSRAGERGDLAAFEAHSKLDIELGE